MASKKKSSSKKTSKTPKKKRLSTKVKTVPITTVLSLFSAIEMKEVLAYLSTTRIKGEIDWAHWEVEDRKHYLQIDKNAAFRTLSKSTKTNMRKEIKQHKSNLKRLTKIQTLLQQVKTIYDKITIKRHPDRSYYPS